MAKTITLRVDNNIYNINYIFNNNNIVDDDEMKELIVFEKDIKKGLEDVKKGRYKILG
jgi:hypothetical protein